MDTNSLMSLTNAKYIYEEIVDSGKWFDTSSFVKEKEKNHYLLGKKVVGLMKSKKNAKNQLFLNPILIRHKKLIVNYKVQSL